MSQEATQSNNLSYHDDEVNLLELFTNLWSQKKLILLITLTSLIVGTSYAILSPPIYQNRVYLLPPPDISSKELQTLGFINSKYGDNDYWSKYSAPYAYEKLISIINLDKTKYLFTKKKSWDSFQGSLIINLPNKKEKYLNVSLQSDSAQHSARWLNEYIDHAMQLTRHEISFEIKQDIAKRLNLLNLAINSHQDFFIHKIDLEIEKLTEALNIANILNLSAPPKTNIIINNRNNNLMTDEIRHLYSPGIKTLKAEIKTLEARKDNKIFSPQLAELLYDQKLIDSLQVNSSEILVAEIDLKAQIIETPIKPKKSLVISISLVFGVILGFMIVLIRVALLNKSK
jgi:chain length determinant protein (polysaccharide antigen chain regulator)